MAELSARLVGTDPHTAFAETIGAAMVNGVPPRIMIGLIVAADEEPALRRPLRGLIRNVRQRIHAMLERVGAPDEIDAARLVHATIVGLAIMHHAQRTPASARDVAGGIADLVRLLGLRASWRGKRGAP